jgi:hypothetical protein
MENRMKVLSLSLVLILISNFAAFQKVAEGAPGTIHVPGDYPTIQQAINAANDGDTIIIDPGTYTEGPQFVINKNLTISGTEKATTIIKAAVDTGSSGDTRGWFLVNSDVIFDLNNVTIDGLGHNIYQAIRDKGQGTITNCIFNNIVYPGYAGLAVVAFGGDVNVTECTFDNIGRIGVLYFGIGVTDSLFMGNNYTGKGDGDWLDYGVEVGAGAHVTIDGNYISRCTGIASVDNSTSAGILVTTYYGEGSQATITHNDISSCTCGIAVGYDESDTSSVVVHENNFFDNECGLCSTAPTIDATRNWWGDPTGPHATTNTGGLGNNITDNVSFEPWLIAPYPPASPVKTLLYVTPADIVYWTPSAGKTFTVDIKLGDVTDLGGYEFKLYWNTTLLDLVNVQIMPPWNTSTFSKNETREDLGRYWLAIARLPPASSFNGNATLTRLAFRVDYDPIYPQNGTCRLELVDTKLSDPLGNAIYHMVYSCTYAIYSTKPVMAIKSPTYTAHTLGETFKINITISGVVNLYNYTFKLSYNTTLLDAIQLDVGPFLNSPTFQYKLIIDHTLGEIWLWVWSYGAAPPASGNGVLATITFKTATATLWRKNNPNINSCGLHLYDTLLVTNTGIEVSHDVTDGLYTYQPKPGDLDYDGKVGLTDLRIMALYYDPVNNSIADIDQNGVVDIFDLAILTYYYGED